MKTKSAYHTIVFAPDSLGPDGPQVQTPDKSLPGLGTTTTLPVPESTPVLYDHRGQPTFFENPHPARRVIGFRPK